MKRKRNRAVSVPAVCVGVVGHVCDLYGFYRLCLVEAMRVLVV